MRRILFVVTSPFAVNAFLRSHLLTLSKSNEVLLCVNTKAYPLLKEVTLNIRVHHIDIERKIYPLKDLRALYQLVLCLRRFRPSVVHSITPKAGLLAMFSACFCRVPHRIHTFTGQVWINKSGLSRHLLKWADRAIVKCANLVFADSESQCRFLEQEKVVKKGLISMLGPGSIAGVDLLRFKPNTNARNELRCAAGTDDQTPVFLFVGRMTKDKGVFDLVEAFGVVSSICPKWELWMVGPDEQGLTRNLKNRAHELGANIRWYSETQVPEDFMAAADVLMLPSYQEGFGSVIIEAAACGVPTIAYRIVGVQDAIVENKTGYLINKGDIKGLSTIILSLGKNRDDLAKLANDARSRVLDNFSSDKITNSWLNLYSKLDSGA